MGTRWIAAVYGAVVYVLFLGTFVYAIGFVEGLVVPKGIDDGVEGAVATAIVVNLVLLAVFALQHSVMARPWFKRWWTRFVGWPIERTTYVLLATAALALLMWQWRPLPDVLWAVESQPWRTVLYATSFGGWAMVLGSTFAIDHFHLFGVQQVARHARGKEQAAPEFRTPLPYRVVRHPLMLGFLVAFWTVPTMTAGRLLFAAATTGYILIALQLEEHDLQAVFGERYARYREQVPMLLPGARRRHGSAPPRHVRTRTP